MKTLVLASGNAHKIKEFKKILTDFDIKSMGEIGFYEDIEENGLTFAENARIKAMALHKFCEQNNMEYYVVADDSGLCVDALDGAPGVFSARYSGEHGNDAENRKLLLKNMKGKTNRFAKFVCSLSLICPNGEEVSAEGETNGIIMSEVGKFDNGFGYDPLFFSCDLGKSFGEASEEEKNAVSHRGRALEILKTKLKNI